MKESTISFGDSRLPARFWQKAERSDTGCWLWTAALQGHGYANFAPVSRGAKQQYGHRLAYETLVGPIPRGLHLDHLCRMRHCVNPAHLEPVTLQENIRRGYWATKPTCPRGHAYDDVNTYVYISRLGYRRRCCRACNSIAAAAYKARKRVAS